MPWILCGPGWPPLRIGDSSGSTAMILHVGLAGLEDLADAGDRAAGADAGDDDVDLAVGVLPDLLRRGLAVDLRVRLVGELAGQDGARTLGGDLLGLGDRALHAEGGVGEDQLGAVGPQQRPALLGHRLRHREDDVVAAGGADQGERDAGVARGRLDDGAAGLELTGALRRVDDRDADAVLDRAGRVVELELGRDRGLGTVGDPVEAHQRGVADELGHVVVDGHGKPAFALGVSSGARTHVCLYIVQDHVIWRQVRLTSPDPVRRGGTPVDPRRVTG